MKIQDIRFYIKKWYELNSQFYITLRKNIYSHKQKNIQYNEHLLSEMYSEYTPVFVLSTGRCGTKFIAKLLQQSDKCDVYHHAKPELIFHQQTAFYNPKKENTKSVIETARLELFVNSYEKNRIYIETNNRLTFFAWALADLFPEAKFIHIVRNPVDFVNSGMRRNWYLGKSMDDIGRIIPVHDLNLWNNLTQFEKIVLLWNETNAFIEKFKSELLDKGNIITFKSEDLFDEFKYFEDLAKFAGIDRIKPSMRKAFTKPENQQKSGNFMPYTDWSEFQKTQLKEYAKLASLYNYNL